MEKRRGEGGWRGGVGGEEGWVERRGGWRGGVGGEERVGGEEGVDREERVGGEEGVDREERVGGEEGVDGGERLGGEEGMVERRAWGGFLPRGLMTSASHDGSTDSNPVAGASS